MSLENIHVEITANKVIANISSSDQVAVKVSALNTIKASISNFSAASSVVIRDINTSYVVKTTDDIIRANGDIIITLLPLSGVVNKPLVIINIGTGTINISGIINGNFGYSMPAQYQSVTLLPNTVTSEYNITAQV